ncbi:hypothetical protein QDA02_gp84 [Microbacterium phage Margaery]|uniref:Uncharacterized protein n=1 Tax=Microbacterium phage Margaery TaxID=2591217 RepID=A0A514DHI4_9CAUD|nr:hypothetical protein QDA02_gp84 [Microbacterium phage Margaery]QDH93081.1 hypothetical protein PBI_MARGAERY_24 [Microbacterium phage Margaery]
MHNDGTGPQYDRPRRPRTITRDEVRRPAPAPTEYERYQALLADGVDDAEARTTIWPDHALLYVAGEDGEDVLLPVGEDGFAIIPDDYVADGDDDQTDDPDGDDETETAAGDAAEDAEDANVTEDAPTPAEPENGAEEAAEATGDEAEPETEPEDAADEEPVTVPDDGYEPADHNRNEVQKYLSENPDQAEYVLARERTGKARVSLIGA